MRAPTILTSLLCLLLLSNLSSFSQCITAPPLENCLGTEPAVANNEVLSAGTKKWYYGAPATFTQLTMRGGTLVVCTELTINVLIMDSGTIVIRPGAKLTAGGGGSGMIWRGGCAVYNYGRFEITSNLSLEGPNATAARPNIVMNVTGAASMRAFNWLVINNPFSFFVNNGVADFHGIITQGNAVAGCVCLGKSSQLRQTTLINNVKDAYSAPAAFACVSVYQSSYFTDTLTNDNNLLVCLGPSHTSGSGGAYRPNAWGTAPQHIFQSCNSCADVELLPVHAVAARPAGEQQEPVAAITVFPNPFLSLVKVSWQDGHPPQAVQVIGAAGNIIYHKSLQQTTARNLHIPLPASLPQGSYIIKIMYSETVVVRKIIKVSP